ncbi:MAG TPA: DUF4386 family protein [Candidatus Dormibacteraeota bacterium]|nr:DUF4386 family protein [Candidatus Dormibacteraeota bacterium]
MRTERWTGIAGLVLFATVVGGIVFETMGPNLSMTPQQVHDSFKNANGAVVAAGAFLLLQKVVLVAFVAGLATLVARGEKEPLLSRLVFAGGILQVAITTVYVTTYVAVASVIDQLSVPITFGIFTVGDSMDLAGGAFLGLMFAGAGYGLARSHVLPRWLGRFGLVAGVLLMLGSFSLLAPQSFFLSLPMLLGVLLGVVWLLMANIALVRRQPAPSA